MRPRDWFLVGVRLIGVWALFRAFEILWPILGVWLQLTSISGPGFRAMNGLGIYSAWQVGGYVATAALFLFGAEWLTRIVFPERRLSPETERLVMLAEAEVTRVAGSRGAE
jgi:hypothetical protein